LVGTIVSRALGLVSSMIVARIIGKIGMGEIGIVQSTVGMFSTLAGLGLGLAATKHVAEHRVANPRLVGETIGLLSLISWGSGFLMTTVVVVLSPWLAQHTLAAPQLAPELGWGALLLLFGVINGVQTGVLSGFEAFKTIARINAISGIANFPLMVGGAYFFGPLGAVLGLVGGLALNCTLNFFAVRNYAAECGVRISYRRVHKHSRLLWQFGLPGMLSGLVAGPVNWLTGTMLVNHPGGYGEMGILNATNSWFQAVAFLPTLLGQVLLPILASSNDDRQTADRTVVLATYLNIAIVFLVTVGICPFSRPIMGFYGKGFAEGWPVLVMTVLAAGVLMVQGPITNQLIADSKMWIYLFAHLLWAVVFLALTFLLVPSRGAAGLAFARFAAYVVNGIGVVAFVRWSAKRPLSKPS
jgi:O-antigen/teichoic acid export membrane protein